MPRLAKLRKTFSEKEAGGDDFKAISSVAINETTSLHLQQKSQRTRPIKSKVAGPRRRVLKQ
jgi:hypothetical protein